MYIYICIYIYMYIYICMYINRIHVPFPWVAFLASMFMHSWHSSAKQSPGPPDPTCRSDVTDVAWLNGFTSMMPSETMGWFTKEKTYEKLKFSMGCPFFCWLAPLSLNLRPAALLGDAMKGLKFFHFPPKVEGMTSDRHSRIWKNVQFAQQCFGAVWGHQNPWAPKIPGSFFLHRFQQPQVRVPAPTANRPRCRWDPAFFSVEKLGYEN